MHYTGRFAPSPTGPLHFGSLVAALGSYLQAKKLGGQWLVRIEDLDPPREVTGAARSIIETLYIHGFHIDGEIIYQSTRSEVYADIVTQLLNRQLAFPCSCSRTEIADLQSSNNAQVYPGTCRDGIPADKIPRAIRLKVENRMVGFQDKLQDSFQQNLAAEVGDFVIRRADGLHAYQLAVVIDDATQGITEVVRGSDLLDSTPRQIYLQQQLGLPTPDYLHLPVVVDSEGNKLSKQTSAPALDLARPLPDLWKALDYLGQHPPVSLLHGNLEDFWRWAIAHWNPDNIPAQKAIPYPNHKPG